MLVHSRAFGLDIASDALIPGLRSGEAPANRDSVVRIHFDALPAAVDPDVDEGVPWPSASTADVSTRTTRAFANGRWISIAFADGVCFVVRHDGREVWFRRPPAIPIDYVATYLLGPVIGLVLRLHGLLCLHASAVVIAGRAVTLVGAAESGKSTTATALSRAGIPVLTDDISVIDFGKADRRPRVRPGFPRMRLWPDSSVILFGPHVELERLTPDWDKRFFNLPPHEPAFAEEARELAVIYMFADRATEDAPSIEPVSPVEGLLALVGNSYANRFLDEGMRRDEFTALTRLAGTVPMFRLTPHADAARLGDLCALLIAHATSVAGV